MCDVGAASLEEAQMVLVAPAGVLAQVQVVRFAGRAAVASQESREGQWLRHSFAAAAAVSATADWGVLFLPRQIQLPPLVARR
jgi:hypothetical protein